jgi:hypothetical protein
MLVSIGCFIGNKDGLFYVNDVGRTFPIHLGFFTYRDFKSWKDDVDDVKISSCHLPGPLDRHDGDPVDQISEIVDWFRERIYTKPPYRFVAHPNFGLYKTIRLIQEKKLYPDVLFCLENFPRSSRKVLTTPIQIIAHNQADEFDWGMCLDTSHLALHWHHTDIITDTLKHTDIIHLSSQKGPKAQHLPIWAGHVKTKEILDLVKKEDRVKEIALEYMAEHKPLCERDLEYVEKYLNEE